MNSFFKSKVFLVTLVLVFISLIVVGVTYAWITWNSTDNTKMTLQIGEYTTVSFDDGNMVNANDLAPVYNFEDGKYCSFTITNSNTDVNKEYVFNIYLDIINIDDELKSNSLKYLVLDNSNYILKQGDFSNSTSNSTIAIGESIDLPMGESSYKFIIYIDGNELNSSNMMNKNLSGNIRITSKKKNNITPITDFTYAINSYDNINITEGKVLLVKYNGNNNIVNIPSTYTINNVKYDTVLYGNSVSLDSTFAGNTHITEVYFDEDVLFSEYNGEELIFNSMSNLFRDCTSLVKISDIPRTITKMDNSFNGCINLEGVIKIDSSDVILDKDNNIFNETSKEIIVEVVESSNTYNSFKDNVPSNVILRVVK